ncbi:GPP34 family phosphoprotein [bacterium]|nr:GPP34 family phosphoprotein [bacterium]
MDLNLPEELLLLCIHDEKGTPVTDNIHLKFGLSGAIVLELMFEERLSIVEKKLIVAGGITHTNPLFQATLELISASRKNKDVRHWIPTLANKLKNMRKTLLDSLIEKGILRHEEGKILWVFPHNTYPTDNPSPENTVRQRIRSIVLGGSRPDARTASLISLVHVTDLEKELFEKPERKSAKRRMKEISQELAVTSEVGRAISEAQAAVAAAVSVAITAAASSSS